MKTSDDLLVDILRDSELLQWAIVERMDLNPKIRDENAPVTLTNAQTLLQQHEIRALLAKLADNRAVMRTIVEDDQKVSTDSAPNVEALVESFKELIEESDTNAIQMLSETDTHDRMEDVYNMMTADVHAKGDLVPLQSEFTANIRLSQLFTNKENFGSYLDLRPHFNVWLQLPRKQTLETIPSYFEYLKNLTVRNTNVKMDESVDYLTALESYLHSFWINTHPLDKDLVFPTDSGPFADKTALVCLVCNTTFTKEGPMDNHLKSKKHLNKCKSPSVLHYLTLEQRISFLVDKLGSIFTATVAEVERVNLLTTREWQLEQNDKQPQSPSLVPVNVWDQIEAPNEPTKSDDKIENNPLNLPLGPDGKPIPYWLFKMKGLRREFKCEVCGNKSYRGRGAFTAHFQTKRHTDGLAMIGVPEADYSLFDDLGAIDEVKALLKEQSEQRNREKKFEADVEQVEADNGDVLSRKVYNQLQKQGLI